MTFHEILFFNRFSIHRRQYARFANLFTLFDLFAVILSAEFAIAISLDALIEESATSLSG